MNSIIACATISLKEINEDSCSIIENEKSSFKAIVVTDGLGSHKHSDFASSFITNYFKKRLEDLETIEGLSFDELFQSAKQALVEEARSSTAFNFIELSKGLALSTTAICVVETETHFHIAYSGNGSIWHVAGSFNRFSNTRYLPWNAINLLNPHCLEEAGKSALYRYISISDVKASPTVITINKNTSSPGEWIMISTDGIYSYDAVIVGKDEDGKIWISGEESMELFYKELSALLSSNPLELKSEDLKFSLERYLQVLKEKKLIFDDCTLGVIIPSTVLRYQDSLIENKKTLTNEANTNN